MDCTFCLDCVKACPHDNIGILAVAPGRDLVNDPVRSSLGRFSRRLDVAALALVLVFSAFVSAAAMVVPVAVRLDRLTERYSMVSTLPFISLFFLIALVLAPALLVSAAIASGRAVQRGVPSQPTSRSASSPLFPADVMLAAQLQLLDAGFLLALYVGWRIARGYTSRPQDGLQLLAPWATVAAVLYATGVWVVFQPMQMRGMVHG